MRNFLTLFVVALSFVAATLSHADQGAPRQPVVNVPDDQQDYQYPPEQDQRDVVINNNNYQFNGGNEYLSPGYGGIPQNFQCNICQVFYTPGWAEVVAFGQFGGGYRVWAGFPGPGNANLIWAVNSIKAQTGMCQNLPFLQPGFVPGFGGPWWGPRPGPGWGPGPGGPGPGPGWGRPGHPGRPGWGPRPPRPTPYIR